MEGSLQWKWITWTALGCILYLLGVQAHDAYLFDSEDPEHLFDLYPHNIEKREFRAASAFRKVGRMSEGASSFGGGVKGRKEPSQLEFAGGCKTRPVQPANAQMRCAKFSGCRVSCLPGYMFSKEKKQLFVTCQEGEWQIEGTELKTIPHCEAICLPPCQHNGICVAPNECNCPESYTGPQCQYEKRPCLNIGPSPVNARRTCNSRSCTITCLPGHQFPDGSGIANMICKDGEWTPSRSNWTSIPDCQPMCNPPCQNGGVCLAFNVCQCPQDFRGPQCQYDALACSPKKMNFNGGYKCNGNEDGVSCTISCPPGANFKSPPSQTYTCQYADGSFYPQPIPQCAFDDEVELIQSQGAPTRYTAGRKTKSFTKTSSLSKTSSSKMMSSWKYNSSNFNYSGSVFGSSSFQVFTLIELLPRPGHCYTWGHGHYKSFDGIVYSFESGCSYTLIADKVDSTFIVNLEPKETHLMLRIFAQDKEYLLTLTERGIPVLQVGEKVVHIPNQLVGVTVDIEAHYVVFKLTAVGLTLKWDGKDLVDVHVSESLWNRTSGLCGILDGKPENDIQCEQCSLHHLTSFINSWKVTKLGEEVCSSPVVQEHACSRYNARKVDGPNFNLEDAATSFCNKLLVDPRFAACRAVVDVKEYYEACRWDFCACQQIDRTRCACNSLAIYAKVCNQHGKATAITSWRDESLCPMSCTGGRIYYACAPSSQETCRSVTTPAIVSDPDKCEEGCYCPKGTVLHEQRCISREQCPCQYRGRTFPPGKEIPKGCNTCTCVSGEWVCTQVNCRARCGAVGDPHYETFDGRRFDFMGKCSYYLMKGENYSIEAENIACPGSISQEMVLSQINYHDDPSCTKAVTINLGEHTIKLKQQKEVLVNGQSVTQLPFTAAGAYIHVVSSIFLMVELPNKLEIIWDGVTRVYIDAPPEFRGNTQGLCGTFNQNQKDDFLTPEGDVEQDVIAFANKWKSNEMCENIIPKENPTHPCETKTQNKALAEKHCSKLKGPLFEGCHWLVDPQPYYQDCMYDMCSCELRVGQCLCPIFAAYAKECAHQGFQVHWRNEIRECGIHCPGGQVYQVCGNPCTHSCYDISRNTECRKQCVEGCNCPEGLTLDTHTGECIPISQCPCQYNGIEYLAGYKEVRPGNKGDKELCVCRNAIWECNPATEEEVLEYPTSEAMRITCSAAANQEFTNCEPEVPVTCKNMHTPQDYTPAVCRPGCKCRKGYVLDSITRKCIRPADCPCHHGGKSYSEGHVIQEDCNVCKCLNGSWSCTDKVCPGICSTWGELHFKTFDGRMYDFQGNCEYVLVKGSKSDSDAFFVALQTEPCGSEGISCLTGVKLQVGHSDNQDSISLTRENRYPKLTGLKRTTIREAGLFVFAEVYDLGIVVQWDRKSTVYVKLDPAWKGKVKGLCGNYNDDELDDFQTPSGGVTEVSARLFGDSWRMIPYCPESTEIKDACAIHPNRKLWAMKKCGILKSPVFQPCHSEVPLEPYLDRCIFDTCGCDLGGDCECLCTAIAAYVQQCNIQGVPIKWRSQDLCPMQCDESCSHYSPCVQTCPRKTCDNIIVHSRLNRLCSEDICVEGCEVTPCPDGQVHYNSTSLQCVPIKECEPLVCMQIGDKIYYEGDVIREDDCHKCVCSQNKEVCVGFTCIGTTIEPTPTIPTETETPLPKTQEEPRCKPGWSAWISHPYADKFANISYQLPPPTVEQLFSVNSPAICNVTGMLAIECRAKATGQHNKETGEDVICNLQEGGLICKGGCQEYEMRVLCKCEPCDVANPNVPHEDCNKFYHCKDMPFGPELVEKSCGQFMMYNPERQVCDWPVNVINLRPSCEEQTPTVPITSTLSPTASTAEISTPSVCEDGAVWSSCAYPCSQLCDYFEYRLKQMGYCVSDEDCVPGCLPIDGPTNCPAGSFWRDEVGCVEGVDCTCVSHNGKIVKPGEAVKETECASCQCLNNQYECDYSDCSTPVTTTELVITEVKAETILTETTQPPTLATIATPPPQCDKERLELMLSNRPNVQITASSSIQRGDISDLNLIYSPEEDDNWQPAIQDQNQYLQVDLGKDEAVYGVVVWGHPNADEYVTSYHVLYKDENHHDFVYVTDSNGYPQIFQGPSEQSKRVLQYFFKPVEARYIRFAPLKWHGAIAMKVDIVGCREGPPLPPLTPRPENKTIECNDPMGLEAAILSDEHITASSVWGGNIAKFGPGNARLNGVHAWVPAVMSLNQWIQINFWEPRTLSGIITQGYPAMDSWVESYTVQYSHDGENWIPVLNPDRTDKVFTGNDDSTGQQRSYFDMEISAQHLKIIPVKWHNNIALRLEILGCYKPLLITPPPTTTTEEITEKTTKQPEPTNCFPCPGLPKDNMDEFCNCIDEQWWNGRSCVSRTECPCYVQEQVYQVGAVFETAECERCVCGMGGAPKCEKIKCPSCNEPGLLSMLTPMCGCVCKPCPEDTVLCPTSNICINATFWCDGVQHCSDDEIECPVTGLTTVTTETAPPLCPTPVCEQGYQVVLQEQTIVETGCQHYICVPIPPSTCTISGKTFKTFDGTEFKYETCHHTLAQDMKDNNWTVAVHNKCLEEGLPCTKEMRIKEGELQIALTEDLNVEVNGFTYSASQLQNIGAQLSNVFTIVRVGDTILLQSTQYHYRILWTKEENIKITVPGTYMGNVNGLCGHYNGISEDDKKRPNGTVSLTTPGFASSWQEGGEEEDCRKTVCSPDILEKAKRTCSLIRDELFTQCQNINIEQHISSCVDATCKCMQSTKGSESQCKCTALLGFVRECTSKNPEADLSSWRVKYDCPAICPAPMVHYDCYQRTCEPTCANLKDECPAQLGICVSGCFCPEGLVRKGNKCVTPKECRDCTCDGYGDPHYLTFDRKNYTFNGNCTYVASQDISPNKNHLFQVLVTNGECQNTAASRCTKQIHIVFGENVIHIQRAHANKFKLETLLNGELLNNYPYITDWLHVEQTGESEMQVLIPEIQLEVIYSSYTSAFVVRLPSHTLGGKVEGLCGNCNSNKMDDLKMPNDEITNDSHEFGNSWITPLPGKEIPENCVPTIELPPPECLPDDRCLQLYNLKQFGKCHALVNPEPYIVACGHDVCNSPNEPEVICHNFEAYARECQRVGLCLEWRSPHFCHYSCPPGLEYLPCESGCSKTCENYQQLKEDPTSCELSTIGGCFCPENQVEINGTCKDVKYCYPCDEDGHIRGEKWKKNDCETCECSESGKVTCLKKECTSSDEVICKPGTIKKEIPPPPGECCPIFDCVEGPCEEAVMPNCTKYQKLKVILDSNECKQFICENRTDICVYQHEFIVDEHGSSRPRQPDEQFTSMQEPGSTWEDGLCKQCRCEVDATGNYRISCSVDTCTNDLLHKQEAKDYVLEPVPVPFACCPSWVRIACKENEAEYKVGSVWSSPSGDPCETVSCNATADGRVEKITMMKGCITDCDLGWNYEAPADNSGECCGQCRPVACVVDGQLKQVNSTWKTSPCVTHTCELDGSTFVVKSVTETCPEPQAEMKQNYVLKNISVEGQCCPEIVKEACKVGDKEYKIGETWKHEYDLCKTGSCKIGNDDQALVSWYITFCDKECDLGFKYVPDPEQCCGKCEQYACKEGDRLYQPGETWAMDECTTNICEIKNGTQVITTHGVDCPPLVNCVPGTIRKEGCCSNCTAAPSNLIIEKCKPEYVNASETIGRIKVTRKPHGLCSNNQPIPDLTECVGLCDSHTKYLAGSPVSECKCCQATSTKRIDVMVTCEDETQHIMKVAVPVVCGCETGCGLSRLTKTKGQRAPNISTTTTPSPELEIRGSDQ